MAQRMTIVAALLALIAAILIYQFFYKDWQYKRAAIAQRNELIKIIRPARARLVAIEKDVKTCLNDIARDHYVGDRKAFCNKILDENSELGTKTDAATLVLSDLDSAVRRRYNGIPPGWW
jgi:hypothetical protein